MRRHEYKILQGDLTVWRLNRMSDEGWEFVCTDCTYNFRSLVFRREIEQPVKENHD